MVRNPSELLVGLANILENPEKMSILSHSGSLNGDSLVLARLGSLARVNDVDNVLPGVDPPHFALHVSIQ